MTMPSPNPSNLVRTHQERAESLARIGFYGNRGQYRDKGEYICAFSVPSVLHHRYRDHVRCYLLEQDNIAQAVCQKEMLSSELRDKKVEEGYIPKSTLCE